MADKNKISENEQNQEYNCDFNKDTEQECSACSEEGSTEDQLIENIQCELDLANNQYKRLAADFDNYRKRHAQERESLLRYGAEDTLKKLLPVIDTFERAQKSINDMDDPEKIKESLSVLEKQFMEALEKAGLKKIEAVGKEFDPVYHEAVMQTPCNDVADNTIITELQSGYQLEDKVLRPALVNVAVSD